MIDLRSLAALLDRYGDDLDLPVAPFAIDGTEHDTDTDPVLMGVVNLSQDSWYRESVVPDAPAALRLGRILAAQGAHVVDVGAESVQAHAARVAEQRQADQLVPVVTDLVAAGVPVSVESYHPSVVEACLKAGASVLNLTGSGEDEAMFDLAGRHGASVVMCDVGGENPRELEAAAGPADDPMGAALDRFAARIEHARSLGVRSIAVDPGVGFGFAWNPDYVDRARYQAAVLLQTFRLRRLGVPVCHALPAAMNHFREEVTTAEGFFAVLASLGRTGVLRTHEISRVRGVLHAMADFSPDPDRR
ncbi:dihydropteroate synthase [Nocardioides bruguierae]|uniref:Dihydropteroate synthase n=1 Tax=Nocardioides bruguierae TaxID=2945102 RepID=A0A9X2D8Y4_9ACTN|nr:dihydropteroate synthase [Nocardioides bruguierae]MCM0621538.1 dihydropteroate synthase [Nocardioides bruguierae]